MMAADFSVFLGIRIGLFFFLQFSPPPPTVCPCGFLCCQLLCPFPFFISLSRFFRPASLSRSSRSIDKDFFLFLTPPFFHLNDSHPFLSPRVTWWKFSSPVVPSLGPLLTAGLDYFSQFFPCLVSPPFIRYTQPLPLLHPPHLFFSLVFSQAGDPLWCGSVNPPPSNRSLKLRQRRPSPFLVIEGLTFFF